MFLFVLHTVSGLWLLSLLDIAYCRINIRGIAPLEGRAAGGSVKASFSIPIRPSCYGFDAVRPDS